MRVKGQARLGWYAVGFAAAMSVLAGPIGTSVAALFTADRAAAAELPLAPLRQAPPGALDDGRYHVIVGSGTGSGTGGRAEAVLRGLHAEGTVTEAEPIDAVHWAVSSSLAASELRARGLTAVDDVVLEPAGRKPEDDGKGEKKDKGSGKDKWADLQWATRNGGQSFAGVPGAPDADVDAAEAAAAPEVAKGDGVVVAVIDTGIATGHRDLQSTFWHNDDEQCGDHDDDDHNGYADDCLGWDFRDDDNDVDEPGEDQLHGTHLAGTIAAAPDNGAGIAGIAPEAEIMPLRAIGGALRLSDAVQAIDYAVANGADVINASWATPIGTSPEEAAPLEAALARANEAGVLVVAAAGNDGVDLDTYPVWPAASALPNVVAVGASLPDDHPADFSNYGDGTVDLFAPGYYVVSTAPGGAAALQGTSTATAFVAAAAALVLANDPAASPEEVRARLVGTSDPVPALAAAAESAGRLNVARAAGIEPDGAPALDVDVTGISGLVDDAAADAQLQLRVPDPGQLGGEAFVVRSTMMQAIEDEAYGLVDLPVASGGVRRVTDDHAQVLLGDEQGYLSGDPSLPTDGLTISFSMQLPAGTYAMAVELVTPDDPELLLADPAAVFFVVTAQGTVDAVVDPGVVIPDVPVGTGSVFEISASAGVDATATSTAGAGGGSSTGSASASTSAGTTATSASAAGSANGGAEGSTTGGGSSVSAGGSASTEAQATSGGTDGASSSGANGSGGSGTDSTPPPSRAGSAGAGSASPSDTTAPSETTSPPASPAASPGTPSDPTPTPVTSDGITVNGVAPQRGGATGGGSVTILGRNFPDYPVVTFGNRPAPVLYRSDTQLVVRTPAHRARFVDVTVGDRAGASVTLPAGFRYLPEPDDDGEGHPGRRRGGGRHAGDGDDDERGDEADDDGHDELDDDAGADGHVDEPTLPTTSLVPLRQVRPLLGGLRELFGGLRGGRIIAGDLLEGFPPGTWAARACVNEVCRATSL